MENQPGDSQGNYKGSGFKVFATKRIITAACLIILVVWILGVGLDSCGNSTQTPIKSTASHISETGNHPENAAVPSTDEPAQTSHSENTPIEKESAETAHTATVESTDQTGHETEASHTTEPAAAESGTPSTAPTDTHGQTTDATSTPPKAAAATAPHSAADSLHSKAATKGVTFVNAIIKPIDYELNKRFWGWRPNDILNFTDNINYFQLGVLEVTRRSVVMLNERISRTGSTDEFNPYLEDAANWLMVTATRYWFPSPESKYKECIRELEAYREQLNKGTASFYTRTDNVIPLLASFEDLLGSCDENLVKKKNEDGSAISYFKSDDYFFYAKGVASALVPILEAIHHDFLPTLESRHGTELLHHALISCEQASKLSPLLITDVALDGIFANHRANMAAPISHARFYLGQLIKTLST